MFGVGSVLATTFRIWFRTLPRVFAIVAICFIPVIAWSLLAKIDSVNDWMNEHYYRPVMDIHPALIGVVGGEWIVGGLASGAVAVCTVARIRGERVGMWRGLATAIRRAPSLIAASFVERLATAGVLTMIVIAIWNREEWMWRGEVFWLAWAGLWLLLSSLFYFVWAVAAVERRGPLSSVWRTFALARGNRIKVFAIAFVLWVGAVVISYFIREVMMPPPSLGDYEAYRRKLEIYGYVSFGLLMLFGSLVAVASATTYEQLREAKEGPTPDTLNRVFD